MCLPLAAVAAGASVLGAGVSAYGQIQQGSAAAAAGDYNAQVSKIMATDAIQRGDASEEIARRQQGQLAGTQRATLAARGLDLNSGSPLLIQRDTAQLGQLDAETIRADARREAVGYLNQATLQSAEGANAKSASFLSAFGTVLGGVGTVAKDWYTRPTGSGYGSDYLAFGGPR